MLTKDSIAQKRDILFKYLNQHGAISRGSSVDDIAIVRTVIGVEENDFVALCEHLSEAGWLKFLRKAGTWKTRGEIAALWLTPQGLERVPNTPNVTASTTSTSRPRVFVSYVRANIQDVTRLADALKTRKVEVWFDKTHLKPGDRWANVIRREIAQGDFFLACFSTEYSKRRKSYMNEEITQAIEQLRQRQSDQPWFIPVLLSDCEIPDRSIGPGETLRSFQWVALYENGSIR